MQHTNHRYMPRRNHTQEFEVIKQIMINIKQSQKEGLTFVRLHFQSLRLVVLTDASFANAKDLKSQLRFLILMMDKGDNASIVHFGSSRYRRVTRSLMSAELHALVIGFDLGFFTREMIFSIWRQDVPIEVFVNSKPCSTLSRKMPRQQKYGYKTDVTAIKET